MEKEELQQLIEGRPAEVQREAMLRYNGLVASMRAYQDEPTAARNRDWRDARESLESFVRKLQPDAVPLTDLAAVLEHLKASGWRATRTSLYRHQKEGKIRPRNDGAYDIAAVERYARTWLRQASTGQRVQAETEDLQRRNLELDQRIKQLDIERKELALARERGELIPSDRVEMELAGRAGRLLAGLKHWIQSRASDWIALAGGDEKRVGELIARAIRDLDDHINLYAAPADMEVEIEPDEATKS